MYGAKPNDRRAEAKHPFRPSTEGSSPPAVAKATNRGSGFSAGSGGMQGAVDRSREALVLVSLRCHQGPSIPQQSFLLYLACREVYLSTPGATLILAMCIVKGCSRRSRHAHLSTVIPRRRCSRNGWLSTSFFSCATLAGANNKLSRKTQQSRRAIEKVTVI